MKKIDELKQTLEALKEEARGLSNEKKLEEAQAKLEEIRSIKEQMAVQEELDALENNEVGTKMEKREVKNNEVEVRSVFGKLVQGKKLTEEERALVQSSIATDGGHLVPKEIANDINTLKREYKSAKEIVGVIKVSTEAGSFVVEDIASMTELVNFDEDNDGLSEQAPKFKTVEYKVANYGAITPISKSFLQDETANFMSYLNGNFAKKAIKTENIKIFAELKRGKTATAVATVKDLKKIVNVTLDPAIKSTAVMAMNQDAFNFLDGLEDENGRPLLQPNPANPTQYMVLGLPVHVFANGELPTTGGKAPMYIGSLTEGVKFFDRGTYEVAVSVEAGFTKNQHVARVVERFDVKQADASAYVLAEVTIA